MWCTDECTEKPDSIDPFGFQPGTKNENSQNP